MEYHPSCTSPLVPAPKTSRIVPNPTPKAQAPCPRTLKGSSQAPETPSRVVPAPETCACTDEKSFATPSPIGWEFSEKLTKRQQLQSMFSALGVTLTLRRHCERCLARTLGLRNCSPTFRVYRKLELAEAAAAKREGRLHFQAYGRGVSLHTREIGKER